MPSPIMKMTLLAAPEPAAGVASCALPCRSAVPLSAKPAPMAEPDFTIDRRLTRKPVRVLPRSELADMLPLHLDRLAGAQRALEPFEAPLRSATTVRSIHRREIKGVLTCPGRRDRV